MADIQSDIKVNIDTSSALASIKNLQRQISTFQSAMAKGSAANSAAAQNLQKDLLQNINATGRFAASMTNVRTTTESFTNSLEKNKFSLGEYVRFGAGATKTFGKFFKGEFETINKVARERVKDLQTQYVQLGRDANGSMRAMKIRPLTLDLDDLGTKTQMAGQRQQVFNQLLKQGSTNLLNWGKNTQWAGRQLMVGFTIPLAIAGAAAAKTFMDLEKQAIRFKRVYGDAFSTAEDTEKAVAEVKELASEFTKYGVAIEKTMELAADAAQMGLTGAALTAQIREATRLAVLGEVDQQESLKTSISITNAFGIAAEDLAAKIDFLNAVENETVTAISDLTIAIPKAAPVVRQLGGGIEELAFFLTAMKEGGINASEGANALKSGLASLINPTKVSSEFLQNLGINIKNIVEANKGDVKGIVIDFATALDQLDPLNRARAIEQLFGKFQFARISTLFQNVIAEGNQAQRVLELTNASTAELAAISERELGKVAESATFKYEKAIQDFRMSLAPVGEEFLKAVTPIIEFGTSLIKQFNNMDSGVKGFITNITLLFAGLGPVLLMTIGLLANGIANIIKGAGAVAQLFQKLRGGPGGVANEISYLTQEQIEALSVSASLDQVHNKLQQTFTSESAAVDALTAAYRRAIDAQRSFGIPPTIRGVGGAAPNLYASLETHPPRYAAGVVNVPGARGAGDVVPAMLSPGEAVIPAKQAEKYRGFIASMISGDVPGFADGVMLGMPRSSKSVGKNRDVAEAIYQEFLKSSYANVPPTEYGHQIAPTTGHSFPIFGLGGVYSKAGGQQVFVKPVMDETAAHAEIRGTQIARQAHGLEAPEQRIVVIRDPMDPTRQRRFLALESDLDAKFIQNQPKALFNEEQYFRQLVASLVRVDKDLAAANVFGNVVADVGPAGVFDRASGIRTLKTDLPSMEDQALINLLGIKGGAKRAFAESTLALMAGMTSQQYHQHMLAEIQRVLPSLKQTVAGFGLTDPAEAKAYDAMIKRLETGLSVDWSKFHSVHSAVKIAVPKKSKTAEPVNLANGGMVRGPGGPKDDAIPANLSNGEAVIDAATVKKNPGIIAALFQKKKIQVPGYAENNSNEFYSFGPGRDIPLASRQSAAEVTKILGELKNVTDLIDGMDEVLYQALVRLGKSLNPTNLKRMLNEDPSLELLRSPVVGKGRKTGSQGAVKMHAGNSVVVENIEDLRGVVSEATMNTLERNNVTSARLLDNMVFGGPAAANKGRLTGTEFASNLESSEGKDAFMRYIAEIGNIPPNHPELRNFAESFRQKLLAAGSVAIDDPAFAQMIEQTLQEEIYAVGKNTSQVVKDAFAEARRYSSVQTNITGVAGRDLQLRPNQAFDIGPPENRMQIESITNSQNYRKIETPVADDILFDNKTLEIIKNRAVNAGNKVGEIFAITAGEATIAAAKAKSPSRETIKASQSLVDGVTTTIVGARDDVSNATKTMVAPITQTPGVFSVPGSRRATTNPALSAMPAGTQTGGSRAPRRAGAPQQATGGPNQTGLMAADGMMLQVGASAERASTEIDKLGEKAKKGGVGLLGYGGIVSNLTFAGSALAGVMSSMGGEVGEVGRQLFSITGALFAATSVIQAFTQMKVLELAKTRLSIASTAAFGAAIGPKTAAQAAKGFGATLARLGTFVLKLFTPMGLVIGALGILGFTIFKIIEAQEKQKKAIEAFNSAAFFSSEKLKTLGAIFNVTPKEANFASSITMPDLNSVEINATQAVLNSDNFSTEFAAEIGALRDATPEQEKALLDSMQLRLETAGFEKDAVKAIIAAIVTEAGKTEINLDFLDVKVFSEEGIAGLEGKARNAAQRASKAFEEGYTPPRLPAFESTSGFGVGGDQSSFGNAILATQKRFGIEPGAGGVREGSFSKEAQADIQLLAGEYANLFESIKVGVETSAAPADVLKEDLNLIMDSIRGFDPAVLEKIVPTIVKNLELEDELENIEKVEDRLLILEATASGIKVGPEFISRLEEAGKVGADQKAIIGGIKARLELNALIAEGIELKIKENAQDTLDTATDELDLEIKSLEEDIQKKKDYENAGLDAAQASAVFGDSLLSTALDAAIATGKLEDVEEAIEKILIILKGRDDLAGRTAVGGSQEKGPFEDILSSLKNLAQRSVNVKGGIDEIFKLFGKNKNIKLDKGFESLFVKGNFNTSFSKFLTGVDAKTRNLLVSFKNGAAVLTSFGKAAQKAFEANALSSFRLEVKTSIQEIENKTSAIKILTQNNFSYAEAVNIATNAERAAAITSLANNKNKKALKKVLKDLRLELELVAILEKEQEAQQANDAKIQETKDLLEGVREQIREYNNFAKAQEKLSKSNLTLIEQQAILRDPVLITMYLDGLDPDLLKAKLKQAISPEFIQTVFEEGFNNAMDVFSSKEAKLDLDLKIKTQVDSGIIQAAQREIEDINFIVDDLEANLKRLEVQEEAITETYDKRISALDEIKSINDDLVDQQSRQLTIADALSQGDISAAAKAAQDLRAAQASRSIDMQRDMLEKSKEQELASLRSANGKTRKQLETEIKDLQMKIFEIEEGRLEPAQRRVDLATRERDDLAAALTVLGKTQLEWEGVSNNITLAKIESDLYQSSIQKSLDLVKELEEAWKNASPTQKEIAFTDISASASSSAPVEATKTFKGTRPGPDKDGEKKGEIFVGANATWRWNGKKWNKISNVGKSNSAKKFNVGGMVKVPKAEPAPVQLARGGMVAPAYLRAGGMLPYKSEGGSIFKPLGTDTVPAMLTPGEFVMSRYAVENFGVDKMKAINSGTYSSDSVYNYSINVNVQTDANANDIARNVMTEIRRIDSQKIRGNRF